MPLSTSRVWLKDALMFWKGRREQRPVEMTHPSITSDTSKLSLGKRCWLAWWKVTSPVRQLRLFSREPGCSQALSLSSRRPPVTLHIAVLLDWIPPGQMNWLRKQINPGLKDKRKTEWWVTIPSPGQGKTCLQTCLSLLWGFSFGFVWLLLL